MKKLSKDHVARIEAMNVRYKEKKDALAEAIEKANEKINEANTLLDEAFGEMNEVIGEANEIREEIVSEIENYMDERSDNWRESDRGSAYDSWKDQWSEEIEEKEYTQPDTIDPITEEMPEELLNGDDFPHEPSE